jgi:hypothetical protein
LALAVAKLVLETQTILGDRVGMLNKMEFPPLKRKEELVSFYKGVLDFVGSCKVLLTKSVLCNAIVAATRNFSAKHFGDQHALGDNYNYRTEESAILSEMQRGQTWVGEILETARKGLPVAVRVHRRFASMCVNVCIWMSCVFF